MSVAQLLGRKLHAPDRQIAHGRLTDETREALRESRAREPDLARQFLRRPTVGEPRVKQRHELELHRHRERSANYRKVRDAVKFVIDTPSRMNEHLYLELLHAKRVALHLTSGTVALLDTSDDAAWKVRIVRELPAAA